MLNALIKKCKELGKDSPDLSEEELNGRLAKLIVGAKILDDDAFEIAREAFDSGRTDNLNYALKA